MRASPDSHIRKPIGLQTADGGLRYVDRSTELLPGEGAHRMRGGYTYSLLLLRRLT